jgi:hypothetical protein
MSDENSNDEQVSNAAASDEVSSENAETVQDNAEVTNETNEEEKVLKQSEVNKIVGTTRKEAYDRAMRDFELTHQQNNVQQNSSDVPIDTSNLSAEQVKELIKQEAETRAQQIEAQKIANKFVGRLKQGDAKYDDFQSTIEPLDLVNSPYLAELVTEVDNTEDVLYKIGKDPQIEATVRTLALTNPIKARRYVDTLSTTLKKTQESLSKKNPSEPLDELKPSNTGADNGSMSIDDLTKHPAFKV